MKASERRRREADKGNSIDELGLVHGSAQAHTVRLDFNALPRVSGVSNRHVFYLFLQENNRDGTIVETGFTFVFGLTLRDPVLN